MSDWGLTSVLLPLCINFVQCREAAGCCVHTSGALEDDIAPVSCLSARRPVLIDKAAPCRILLWAAGLT